jgi:hypothetical protein
MPQSTSAADGRIIEAPKRRESQSEYSRDYGMTVDNFSFPVRKVSA